MNNSHKKVDMHYPSLPFEEEDGLSTFDLNLIHRHRKKYVPAFKRREQIAFTSEQRDEIRQA